jgi:enamine deaminase RidA (YjgF/YER057c/UK114 family)
MARPGSEQTLGDGTRSAHLRRRRTFLLSGPSTVSCVFVVGSVAVRRGDLRLARVCRRYSRALPDWDLNVPRSPAMRDDRHVELVRAPKLATSVPYAYSAVAASGFRFVFTAGACPLDETGAIVGVGDVQSQAEQVMSNLSVALEASGARLEDVVKTTVYVASHDRTDLVAAWDIVRRHFGRHDAPSTLVGVTMLGYEGQLVEVEAIAALP